MPLESFAAQARERLREQRRARRRSRSKNKYDGLDDGGVENAAENNSDHANWGDPDADLLVYDSAEGFVRERSPPRLGKRRGRQDASIGLEHDGKDGQRARESRDRYDEENNGREQQQST